MRVLHVTNAWPTDTRPVYGIFVKEQIESIIEVGIDCEVLTAAEGAKGFKKYRELVRLISVRQRGFDLVHTHHVLTAVCAILAGVPGQRIVASFMNERGRNVLRVGRPVSELIERLVHGYVGSAIFKNQSFDRWRRSRDIVVGNGVQFGHFAVLDKTAARSRRGLDPNALICLFVSANFLSRPAKRYDRFQLVLKELATVRANVRELTLVEEPRARVVEAFAAADVLVVCSEFEGSPNAVKEALACGLPVVATNVGDIGSQIEGVPDCFVVDKFDPKLMALRVCDAVGSTVAREHRAAVYRSKSTSVRDVAELIIARYSMLVRPSKPEPSSNERPH